jgi:hypothetical protein
MTQDEIKHDLLQVCKVKGWDGDFNILGFHVLCDKLKQLGAEEEREACAKACEKVAVDMFTQLGREHEPYMKATAEDCAMQIRERGQPKRKWVGLTKDEVETLSYKAEGNTWIAVELAEAKLKEKNNG